RPPANRHAPRGHRHRRPPNGPEHRRTGCLSHADRPDWRRLRSPRPPGRDGRARVNVIGIDPSLAGTGVCLPSGEAYTIKGKLKGDARLAFLYSRIVESIADFHPISLAVLEDLPVNAKSAGLTGMAQGVIRMALASADVPVARIAPATLKKFATGSGKADKQAMYEAIPSGLRGRLDDDNQVDAWWL